MKRLLIIVMLSMFAQACAKRTEEAANNLQTVQPSSQPGTLPTSHAVRRQAPAIDPKSTEAAVDVVQAFVDLLNRRRFDEAFMLLGPSAPPRDEFDKQFSRYLDLRVSIGAAGDQEGAAGSIYLSVPMAVSGRLNGNRESRQATAVLRRVNDVPGSSEAQRHWHIERIDWGRSS